MWEREARERDREREIVFGRDKRDWYKVIKKKREKKRKKREKEIEMEVEKDFKIVILDIGQSYLQIYE